MKQSELNKLFKFVNLHLFDNELKKPIIKMITPIEHFGLAMVYFGSKSMDDFVFMGLTIEHEKNAAMGILQDPDKYEFMDTFVHECIHVWQFQTGLKMNHKKEFKAKRKEARKLGLML